MELHVLYPICVHSMVLMHRVSFKMHGVTCPLPHMCSQHGAYAQGQLQNLLKSKSFRLHLYGGTILDFLGQISTKILKVKLKNMFVL